VRGEADSRAGVRVRIARPFEGVASGKTTVMRFGFWAVIAVRVVSWEAGGGTKAGAVKQESRACWMEMGRRSFVPGYD
jgi:hypothetical protein